MAVATVKPVRTDAARLRFPPSFKNEGVVYAIAFDMDIEQLRLHCGDPYNNACLEIRRVLEHQFLWQQGSMYFGGGDVTARR